MGARTLRLTFTEKNRFMARSSSGACLWVARLVCAHQLQVQTVFRLKHGNI